MLGVPELRQAVAAHEERFYDLFTDWETQTIVGSGATEMLASTLFAMIEEGDEVVVIEPFYDSCTFPACSLRSATSTYHNAPFRSHTCPPAPFCLSRARKYTAVVPPSLSLSRVHTHSTPAFPLDIARGRGATDLQTCPSSGALEACPASSA